MMMGELDEEQQADYELKRITTIISFNRRS